MDKITEQCESWSKNIGCYHTFDGKCGKENCQKYRLMKENEELKEQIRNNKLYKQIQELIQKLKELEIKECVYGGENCYKSMLDAITDESEE